VILTTAAIPALLATGAVHHHLIARGHARARASSSSSAEPREAMHFCLLVGYGAGAVNPVSRIRDDGRDDSRRAVRDIDEDTAVTTLSKSHRQSNHESRPRWGSRRPQSYRGAQIFEAIGLAQT